MSFGVYIHWPYCASKCPYCDFNSHVAETIDHDRWLAAYLREIDHVAQHTPDQILTSIFFGGGTPSLMRPESVASIIEHIRKNWRAGNDVEITLEANPTSVENEKLKNFKEAGVNRISLGIQALNDQDLKFLGRTHSVTQAKAAIDCAAENFERFSFDLMYARPDQTVAGWRAELQEALTLASTHLSLYQLTIEEGTPFFTRHARGEFQIPKQDLAADLYDVTQEITSQFGLFNYEVSNHAKPGQESRHNLIYWRYQDYAGIGPGAHGRLTQGSDKFATRTHRAPEIWLSRVETLGHGYHPFDKIEPKQRLTEALMMGLRLQEPVLYTKLKQEYGLDIDLVLPHSRIKQLEQDHYLITDQDGLRTTAKGLKCLNAVLEYLMIGQA
jgi:oxygen-independent coproporphyrinogen-3 oxidase